MAKTMDEIEDELFSHLEFTIEHGGFSLIGPGGCSCSICCYLRGYLALKYYTENKEWYKLPDHPPLT